jgi:hypothetical protein
MYISKIVQSAFIWVICFILYKIFYPITTLHTTLNQFTNSPISTSGLELQQLVWYLAWFIPIVITILIYKSDIKKLIKKIRS